MSTDFEKNVVVIKNNEQWINESQKKHVFVMFFMNGCGPCNYTKPLWEEIAKIFNNKKDVLICAVESEVIGHIFPDSGITGFPTLRYYHRGIFKENFQGSQRSVDEFKKWINNAIKKKRKGGKTHKKYNLKKRRSSRKRTRNWLNLW